MNRYLNYLLMLLTILSNTYAMERAEARIPQQESKLGDFELLPADVTLRIAEELISSLRNERTTFNELLRKMYDVRGVSKTFARIFGSDLIRSSRKELFSTYLSEVHLNPHLIQYGVEFLRELISKEQVSEFDKRILPILPTKRLAEDTSVVPPMAPGIPSVFFKAAHADLLDPLKKEGFGLLEEALSFQCFPMAKFAIELVCSETPNAQADIAQILTRFVAKYPALRDKVIELLLGADKNASDEQKAFVRQALKSADGHKKLEGLALTHYFNGLLTKNGDLSSLGIDNLLPADNQRSQATFNELMEHAGIDEFDKTVWKLAYGGDGDALLSLVRGRDVPKETIGIALYFAITLCYDEIVLQLNELSGEIDALLTGNYLSVAIHRSEATLFKKLFLRFSDYLVRKIEDFKKEPQNESLALDLQMGGMIISSLLDRAISCKIPHREIIRLILSAMNNLIAPESHFSAAGIEFILACCFEEKKEIKLCLNTYAFDPVIREGALDDLPQIRALINQMCIVILGKRGFIDLIEQLVAIPDFFLLPPGLNNVDTRSLQLHGNQRGFDLPDALQRAIDDGSFAPRKDVFRTLIKGGFSPLHVLCAFGQYDYVKNLINVDNRSDEFNKLCLNVACAASTKSGLLLMLSRFDLSVRSFLTMNFDSSYGELVKCIIEKNGYKGDSRDLELALHFACIAGNLALVEYLVSMGVSIEALTDGRTPLEAAASSGASSNETTFNNGTDYVIRFLISHGAQKQTPFLIEYLERPHIKPEFKKLFLD